MSDVLVVGGGTGGLAAAIYAAQRDFSVTVFEPRADSAEKPCGEGLMPLALRRLAELGIELRDGYALTGVAYMQNGRAVYGDFRQGFGLGIRRLNLQQALRQRARDLGVIWRQERAERIEQTATSVAVNGAIGKWLIAADGLKSKISQQFGLVQARRLPPRFGVRAHYAIKPWSPYVEVHWGKTAELYVTPVAQNIVNVALLGSMGTGLTTLQQEFAAVYERLGTPLAEVRGAGPFERRLRQRQLGRIFFVGDAAGFLDPITGEGNHLAMVAAAAAVRCIELDRPGDYDRLWLAATRRYDQLTRLLLRLARSRARALITPCLAVSPRVFSQALAFLAEDRRFSTSEQSGMAEIGISPLWPHQ